MYDNAEMEETQKIFNELRNRLSKEKRKKEKKRTDCQVFKRTRKK